MTDKHIIYNCPHISRTDWGTYACKLYNPRDKNCLVVGGNCDSNVGCPYKQAKAKEQECEELKVLAEHNGRVCNQRLDKIDELEQANNKLLEQLDQLKAEVKSKTEYIQEQREIINQYSKEIEMYKKCQGKRASKREEELKAENERLQEERENAKNYNLEYGQLLIKATNENHELKAENKHLNDLLNQALNDYEKARETLTEIKEIADDFYLDGEHCKVESLALEILQKISEVEE